MMSKYAYLRVMVGIGTLAAGVYWLNPQAKAQGVGEKVYKAKCAMCHGADGKGDTPAGKGTKARDFCSDEVQKESDEDWTGIVVKGKNKMPAYDKKLTDVEIKEVVTYVLGLCKK